MIEFQTGAVEPIGCNEKGWQLIKNDYWLFFGMTFVLALIMALISLALNFVLGTIVGGLTAAIGNVSLNAGEAGRNSISFAPQLAAQFVSLITSIIVATLSGMFACGIYTALSRKARGETVSFEDLFAGFQYFQPCLIVSLFVSSAHFLFEIVMFLIETVFGISSFETWLAMHNGKVDPNTFGDLVGTIAGFVLIYLIFTVLISVCTLFVYPLITDAKLSAIEALKTSAQAGFGNFFGVVGLFIVQFVMSILGALLCGIGILFVLPILSAGVYSAYQNVFGRSSFDDFRVAPPAPPIFNHKYNF